MAFTASLGSIVETPWSDFDFGSNFTIKALEVYTNLTQFSGNTSNETRLEVTAELDSMKVQASNIDGLAQTLYALLSSYHTLVLKFINKDFKCVSITPEQAVNLERVRFVMSPSEVLGVANIYKRNILSSSLAGAKASFESFVLKNQDVLSDLPDLDEHK